MKVRYILLPGIFMKIFKAPGKVPIGRALSKKQWMLTWGSVKICQECKNKLTSQAHFAETAGSMSGQKLYLHLPWPPWRCVADPVKLAAVHFLPESSENRGDLPSSESSTPHTATSASHFEAARLGVSGNSWPCILRITDFLIPSPKAAHFFVQNPFLETYVCVRFQVSHNSVPILQHPKLPLARMIHIPRSMMTINLADRSSFSTVTYSCQKMWHCTPNCHLLVWPIYQAQWWKL